MKCQLLSTQPHADRKVDNVYLSINISGTSQKKQHCDILLNIWRTLGLKKKAKKKEEFSFLCGLLKKKKKKKKNALLQKFVTFLWCLLFCKFLDNLMSLGLNVIWIKPSKKIKCRNDRRSKLRNFKSLKEQFSENENLIIIYVLPCWWKVSLWQNISKTSQQNVVAAFSYTTAETGDFY